jgi:PKD repeat protein
LKLGTIHARKLKRKFLLTLLIWMMLYPLFPAIVFADPVILQVNPQSSDVTIGDPFNITVTITGVTNLTGWEFKLFYKNTLLNCTQAIEEDFLKSGGDTFFLKQIDNAYNSTYGRCLLADTLQGANVAVNGNGTLVTIMFLAVGVGNTTLALVDTKLSDEKMPPQPIDHSSIDGEVHVKGITPAPVVLKVNPQSSDVTIGDPFNITVTITGVTNLTGWEFKLFYRNAVVNCTNAVEGPFLQGGGDTFFLKQINNAYNSTYGRCLLADTLQGSNVVVNGNGTLVTIVFQAIGPGNTPLALADTKLSDEKMPPQPIGHQQVDGTVHVRGPTPTVAVSPQSLTGPPGWISINQTFTVNVTITLAFDLHYWQAGMAFNPNVLQCINFTEGPFLRTGGNTVWQTGTIDNNAGTITPYGASLTSTNGVSGNGTLAYITFMVKDTGASSLQLQYVILLDSNNIQIAPVNLQNGYFELAPEVPKPPTAYFNYYPTALYANETVTFDATGSSPNGGTITDYEWNFGDTSQDHGMIVNHTYTTADQYNVTLTVTNDRNLTDSYQDVVNVLPPPIGPIIDAYTQRGGTGENQPSDAYAPQEFIIITAYVTYNLAPIQDNLVTFYLYLPNGTQMLTRTTTTNDLGLTFITYQIPTSPIFGLYTAQAISTVGAKTVTDVIQFKIGWLIEILNVIPIDRHGLPKNQFNPQEPFFVKLKIQNIRFGATLAAIFISVFDEQRTPIIFQSNDCLVPPGLADLVISVGIIPGQAYMGRATVYADALKWHGGPTFCPEKSTDFWITIPHPDVAVFNVAFSPTNTYAGHSVLITVSVTNEYYLSQSFNVTVRSNSTALQEVAINNLAPYSDTNFEYAWDTYTVPPGNCTISANASIVPGETHIADNTYVGGIVHISQRTGPVHDLAITEVALSKDAVGQGCSMPVNATAQNQGDFTETLNATVYANTTIVASITNISLTSGASTTITFIWNTTGLCKGNYTITVAAAPVPDENDTLDNTLTAAAHWVTVSILGDITGPTGCPDGKVDARDVAKIASLFGIKNPNPKYDLSCDITGSIFGLADGKLDARDVSLVSSRYGQKDP